MPASRWPTRPATRSSLACSSPPRRTAAEAREATARGSAARPADPTAAYCVLRSSWALADHGISSQSRHTQAVSRVVHRSAAVIAVRSRSRNRASNSGSLKNRRPVRVVTMPTSPSRTPNRSRAACLVPADDDHRPRPHVLLLADHLRGTLGAVVGERLGRVFEQPRLAARLARGHGGRQVDQPLGVGGEPAHHLQGGGGVGLPDRHVPPQPGGDDPLAQHVLGVEQVVVGLLGGQLRGLIGFGEERPGRFAVRRSPPGPRRTPAPATAGRSACRRTRSRCRC